MNSSTDNGNNAQVVHIRVADPGKLGLVIETEDAKIASISNDEAGQQARSSGARVGMIVEEIDGEPFDRHTLVNKRETNHRFVLKLIKASGPPLGAGLAKSVKILPGERLTSFGPPESIIGAWYGKPGDEWKPWKKNGTDVTEIVKKKLKSGEEVCAQTAALGISDPYKDKKRLVVLFEAEQKVVQAQDGTAEAEPTPTIRANDDYRWCWAKSGPLGASAYFQDPFRWSNQQNTEATIKDLKSHQQEPTPVYLECQRDPCNCVWVFDTCENAISVLEALQSEAEKRKDEIQSCRQHLATNKIKLHAGRQVRDAITLRAGRNVTIRAILERIKSAVDEADGIPEFPRDILEDAARHREMWEKYKAITLGLEPALLAELNVSLEELKNRARKEGVEEALDGLEDKEAVLQRILVKKAEATPLPGGWKVRPSQCTGGYDIYFSNDSQASWTHPHCREDYFFEIDRKDLDRSLSNLDKFNTCMKESAEEFAAMIEFLEESITPVQQADVSDLVKRVEAELKEAKEERLKTREEFVKHPGSVKEEVEEAIAAQAEEKYHIHVQTAPTAIPAQDSSQTNASVAATRGAHAISQTNVEVSPAEPDSQTNVEVAATPGTEVEFQTNASVAATRGAHAISQTNVEVSPTLRTQSGSQTSVEVAATPGTEVESQTNASVAATGGTQAVSQTSVEVSPTEPDSQMKASVATSLRTQSGSQTNVEVAATPGTEVESQTSAPVAATAGTQAVSQTNVEVSPTEADSQTEASVAATPGTQSGSQTNREVAATPGTEVESQTNASVAATGGTQAVSQTNVEVSPTEADSQTEASVAASLRTQSGSQTNVEVAATPGAEVESQTNASVAATRGAHAISQTNVEVSPTEPDSQMKASVAALLDTQSGSQTNVEVAATPGTEVESQTSAPVAATRGTGALSQTNVNVSPTELVSQTEASVAATRGTMSGSQTNVEVAAAPGTEVESQTSAPVAATGGQAVSQMNVEVSPTELDSQTVASVAATLGTQSGSQTNVEVAAAPVTQGHTGGYPVGVPAHSDHVRGSVAPGTGTQVKESGCWSCFHLWLSLIFLFVLALLTSILDKSCLTHFTTGTSRIISCVFRSDSILEWRI